MTMNSLTRRMADFAIAGLQSGRACLMSANTPAMCGLDIDVPEIAWKSSPGGSAS